MCKSGLLGSNVSAMSRVFSASGNLSRMVSICAFLIKKFAEKGYCEDAISILPIASPSRPFSM